MSAVFLREGWSKALASHEGQVPRETGPAPLDVALIAKAGPWDDLSRYAEAVLDENRYISLVSRKNPEEIIQHNILDSLLLVAAWLQVPRETAPLFLDAGTGSGVPGIPATLLCRHLGIEASLILIESNEKKQGFLDRMAGDKADMHVFRGRLESERLPDFLQTLSTTGQVPVLTSRALATISRTLVWARGLRPHLQEALFFKGPETAEQEIREADQWESLGWRLEDQRAFYFPHRETRLLRLIPSS